MSWIDRPAWQTTLLVVSMAGLGVGGLLSFISSEAAAVAWAIATAIVLASTAASSLRDLLKGETGVDLVAVLAMAGALILGQYLAGAIIAVMLAGGGALERLAVSRARRELRSLLERAPRFAHRIDPEGITEIGVAEVRIGDVLSIRPGEVIPVDGILVSARAVLDEAALTGEPLPVSFEEGARIRSGGTNAGGPFELKASASAKESTYAGIIRLVAQAEQSKAPFVRLADRWALGFVGVTLALASIAWLISGNPIRALAVLVVATPCPLILAAPAAIIAGVSRAARHGVIIKGGGPLEILARATVLLLDKTGTITAADPEVVAVESFGALSTDELVRLAASVEQVSLHPFAPAILAEAKARKLGLSFPTEVEERLGTGVQGRVDGRLVAVGQAGWVGREASRPPGVRSLERRASIEGSANVFIAVDGRLEGALVLRDPIRSEAPRNLRALRQSGIRRIHMVTGDHPGIAELVGDMLGIDHVFAERSPAEKVDVVRRIRREGLAVMVGDGINDAPALAVADVGVAMGARGASAASEAADVVLTANRLEGLVSAVRIAKRTRAIAMQSVVVGMGLSFVAMIAATAGYIGPVEGAVLQEGIDVLVILNALRALGGRELVRAKGANRDLARDLAKTHARLRPDIGELANVAARLDTLPPPEAKEELETIRTMLEEELLPHEWEEQRSAYPVIAKMLENEDPTGPLIQTHHEIRRLARLYARLVEDLPEEGPGPEDLRDLRRALYGLHAVLSLHFAQEEEVYSLLEA